MKLIRIPVAELRLGDIMSVNTGYRPLDDENCEVTKIVKQQSRLFKESPHIEYVCTIRQPGGRISDTSITEGSVAYVLCDEPRTAVSVEVYLTDKILTKGIRKLRGNLFENGEVHRIDNSERYMPKDWCYLETEAVRRASHARNKRLKALTATRKRLLNKVFPIKDLT